MDIRDKVAIITGAVGGLGAGFTRAILHKGGKVCLVDTNNVKGREDETRLRAEFGDERVIFVACDVTKVDEFKGAFDCAEKHLGVVEVVCNNAGILSEFTPDFLITTNFTSVCHGTNIAIERMRKDRGGKGGVIINTSSIAGLHPQWYMPIYTATKAAIYAYTSAWAMNPNDSKYGIRFNTLCPSAVSTPLQGKAGCNVLDDVAHRAFSDGQDYLTVEEVAEALCLLITEDRNGDALLISKGDGIRFVTLNVADLPKK